MSIHRQILGLPEQYGMKGKTLALTFKEHCIALVGTKTPQGMPIRDNVAKPQKKEPGGVQGAGRNSDLVQCPSGSSRPTGPRVRTSQPAAGRQNTAAPSAVEVLKKERCFLGCFAW